MAENGKLSADELKRLQGQHPQSAIPPGMIGARDRDTSPSEGSLSKFSYRTDLEHEGFFTRAVANPDGTRIAQDTNAKLQDLIDRYVAPFVDPNVAADLAIIKALLSGDTKLVIASQRLTAAGDYAANDVLSDEQVWWFQNCAREPGRGFMIMGVRVLCSTEGVLFRPRISLFNESPGTPPADNAPFSITEGMYGKYLGALDLAAFADVGTVAATWDFDVRMEFPTAPDSKDSWAIVQTLDAEAGEAAGMAMEIMLIVRQL